MSATTQSATARETPVKGPESLDIYEHARIRDRWNDFATCLAATTEDAEASLDGAIRLIVAHLFKDKVWRTKHPRALSDGLQGSFARTLLKLHQGAAAENLREAFEQGPGTSVLDFYIRNPHLHRNLPAGLVPGAQKRLVRWLFDHGREEEGFLETEILCFLQLCMENRSSVIAVGYLLQPDWQERFPQALTREGGGAFLDWLDREFKPQAGPLSPDQFPPAIPSDIRSRTKAVGRLEMSPFNWRPAKSPARHLLFPWRRPRPGVNVLGPLCFMGGVGQAVRITAHSLQTCGIPVNCRDIPGAPPDTPRCEYLGLESHPTTIIHALPDDPPEALFRHAGWPLAVGKYRIGVWYWELENLPPEWAGNENYLNEIWAPTNFIASTVRKSVSIPVVTMLPAVEMPRIGNWSRAQLGIPGQKFIFLFMFDMLSTFQRKNPLAVVNAFRIAKLADASLVIKVSRGYADTVSMTELHDEASRCGAVVLDEVMTREKSLALVASCNCYVSLHRAEGFGLPLAEAMLLAKPVIGTRYSGNLDFMNEGNSLLVDCSRVPVGPGVRYYPAESMWAEPSVEHAAAQMRWVMEHHEAANKLGKKAKADCSELLSLKAYGRRMQKRLSQIHKPINADFSDAR